MVMTIVLHLDSTSVKQLTTLNCRVLNKLEEHWI